MADYDAKIRVSADTKQADSELSKLQKRLDQLGDAAFKLDVRNFQKSVRDIGTAVQGIGQRGALGALTLAAGKATTAVAGLGAKFGVLGAVASSAGSTINNALGGVPSVITDILNHIGQIPNAFGIAAVAAMAFAPQLLKASSAATGLAAAVDKAVGTQATQKIAEVVNKIGQLNIELNATTAAFQDLIAGSTLNQLNEQLKDAVKESGEFHSSTEEAVVAAQQLVAVQKEQRKEQKAINDLIRQAQGLQPQDVRDAELNRRVALLKSREIQQQKDLKLQNQINTELAEYEQLAQQVAAQTKQWAVNLERVARSSKAGVFGTQSQLRTRLQEFQENRRSAEIARQRNAELVARERAMAGGQYSLAQVPARGELFPGGRTETASEQYRSMLNAQARVRAAAAEAVAKAERTVLGVQAQTLRTEQDIIAAKRQQQTIDERSIQTLRERNKILLEQYKAEQRVAAGVLDPASLRADRQRRVEQGRAAQKQSRQMTENVIIGGAFPLLFGGGPGAVIGGAAGGFIPGNPMLSVATSALGGIFDQFAAGVAELGQALNPLTADIDKIVTASGLAGTQTAKYIKTLEDAGRESDALAVATEELSFIVGRDGANALREFGEQTQQLTNKWSILTTQVGAALAQLLSGPVGQLLKAVETATALSTAKKSQDPELQRLNKQLSQAGTPFMIGGQTFGGEDRVAIEEKIVERVREIKKEREQELALANAASSVRQVDLNVLQAELELAKTDGDLTKEVVYQLQRKLIIQQTNVKLQDAINKKTETETILLEEKVKLQQLEQQRRQALERQEEEYTNKSLNLQKELRNVTLDTYKLNKEITAFQQGDLAAYKQEIAGADKVLSNKIAILNIEHQLALAEAEKTGTTYQVNELHHIRLQIVREQHKLDIERTKRLATELQLEKDLAKIKGARQVSEAARGITRQIQDVQVSIASPFGSTEAEMLTLRIEQTRRYEDAVRSVNDQIEEQQKLIDAGLDIEGKAATQIGYLQQELALYKQLLPELNAYEQAQLRQKQIIDSLQPAMSGLSAGMTNVVSSLVTGTQTVQQALADMFAQIGQAYISMAAEIITKQLVMITLQTILKALGAVSGGGGGASDYTSGASTDAFVQGTGGIGGNYFPTSTPFKPFATGGYVTGPTNALIGEGGESEYIIPASKMRGAMNRYAAGARGSSVIPGSGGQAGGEMNGGTATATPIDVRYTVERINNVDYVTADQFQAGMRQAATEGARRGEQQTLRKLQTSASTRRRIGV